MSKVINGQVLSKHEDSIPLEVRVAEAKAQFDKQIKDYAGGYLPQKDATGQRIAKQIPLYKDSKGNYYIKSTKGRVPLYTSDVVFAKKNALPYLNDESVIKVDLPAKFIATKPSTSKIAVIAPRIVPKRGSGQVFTSPPMIPATPVVQGKFHIGFASLLPVGNVILDRRNDGSTVASIEVRNYQGKCVLPTTDGMGIVVSTRANSSNLEADIKKELLRIPSENLLISLDPSTRGAGTYRASKKPAKKA